jgi:Zinc carboxypeptidase
MRWVDLERCFGRLKRTVRLAWVTLLLVPGPSLGAAALQTPLEKAGYAHLSSVAEVTTFLAALAQRNPRAARHIVLGRSAGGRPLDGLLISNGLDALASSAPPSGRLRVMIVGSQHGTETSGAEAVLMLSRNLLEGPEHALLADLEFILLPLGNPDGRAAGRRQNDNGVNLSTDFSALTQPESRALLDALVRWQPDVFIDLHESSVFKAKTLARQGYMTNFEAQFEIANNPNIDSAVAAFSRERVRPEALARVQRRGLKAENYIGEIIDINQPIMHGGLTLRNIRNRAGMEGAFSLLIENRLDSPQGTYPTPANIGARTAKQLLSVQELLAVCRAEREAIAGRSRAAHKAQEQAATKERVSLVARYAPLPDRDTISIELQRIDNGQLETRSFPYFGRIVPSDELVLPGAYAITAHQERIGEVLKRQHIGYETLPKSRQCQATVQHIVARELDAAPRGLASWQTTIDEREMRVRLPAGTLWIDLRQPRRRLASLLLEPRSNSSLFEHRDFAPLVTPGKDFFVLRINNDCG